MLYPNPYTSLCMCACCHLLQEYNEKVTVLLTVGSKDAHEMLKGSLPQRVSVSAMQPRSSCSDCQQFTGFSGLASCGTADVQPICAGEGRSTAHVASGHASVPSACCWSGPQQHTTGARLAHRALSTLCHAMGHNGHCTTFVGTVPHTTCMFKISLFTTCRWRCSSCRSTTPCVWPSS